VSRKKEALYYGPTVVTVGKYPLLRQKLIVFFQYSFMVRNSTKGLLA